MTDEPEKIELSAGQKTRLLHLGLEAAPDTREGQERKADLLYDVLDRPLSVDSPAVNSLPTPLRGLSRSVRSIAGAPLVELLIGSDTNISAIEAIKEYAKQSGKAAKSDDQTDVFLSVYYAAIASGLLFHGRKITEHSYKHLAEAFGALTEKDWIQEELSDLMTRARQHCNKKISRVDGSN
ncbi:MAG: hypothetical protein ACYSWO_10470 [Planctomycetota bacterium]|jgi:hypothetical protein